MRIALVHSYYSSRVPSGENRVVDAQARALRDVGHEVQVVAELTDRRLRRRTYPLEAAFTDGDRPRAVADCAAPRVRT